MADSPRERAIRLVEDGAIFATETDFYGKNAKVVAKVMVGYASPPPPLHGELVDAPHPVWYSAEARTREEAYDRLVAMVTRRMEKPDGG
jgi:hypothetical protein